MQLSDVNLVAVLATTIVQMLLGMLWYGPKMFGNQWMQLTGMTMEKAEAGMKRGFKIGTFAAFLGVLAIALLLAYVQPSSLKYAIKFGIMIWLVTFVGELGEVAWEQRPVKLMKINAGWTLLSILASVVILYQWPW